MMNMQSHMSDAYSEASFDFVNAVQPISQSFPSTIPKGFNLAQSDISQLVDHASTTLTEASPSYDTYIKSQPTQNMSRDPTFSETQNNSAATSILVHPQGSTGTNIDQALSKSSQSSNASNNSNEMVEMSRTSSAFGTHQVVRQKSADGQVKEAVSIPRTTYVRPLYNKLKCKKCGQTCKGEHELRRHESKHATNRKRFVCVDISPKKDFLASCKACATQKEYNIYYNAAAHLRRVHFCVDKKKSKAKSKDDNTKSSNSGELWPGMDTLRHWMKEVERFVPENMPEHDDDSFDDEEVVLSQTNSPETKQPSPENLLGGISTQSSYLGGIAYGQTAPYFDIVQSAPASLSALDQALTKESTAEQQQQQQHDEENVVTSEDTFGNVSDQEFIDNVDLSEFPMLDPSLFPESFGNLDSCL